MSQLETEHSVDLFVIGGGINGLSALYHLTRLGCRHLGLVEQFRQAREHVTTRGTVIESHRDDMPAGCPIRIRFGQLTALSSSDNLQR